MPIIPTNYLNTLRAASNSYMMTDLVQILRTETFTDEYGGTYQDYNIVNTLKCRLVHKKYSEIALGGGLSNRDEYLFIFPDQTDVRFEDKIKIVNDPNTDRYFLVVGVDDVISQGIFKTAKTEENYN